MKVFCIDKTVNKNILEAQLLTPLNYIKQKDFTVLLPSKYQEYSLKNILYKDLNLIFYNSNLNKYKFILRKRKSISSLYCRSVFEFFIIFLIKSLTFSNNLKITYDFRGLAFAESELKSNNFLKKSILKKLEYFAYVRADKINTVSINFKNFLQDEFKFRKDISVIPCCVEAVTKGSFNKNTRELKFVYLGSVSKWQKVDLVLEIFSEISSKIDCSLTIITNQKHEVENLASHIGVNVKILSLPHSEINEELQNYDFGFLLRDNILLNNVASPVKFLEYISNGVIPIISEGVGDYSSIVKKNKIGILYNTNTDELINQIFSILKDTEVYDKMYKISQQYVWEKYYIKYEK